MLTRQTLLTADDLLKLPDDGYRYELIDGELVQMAPPGGEHGGVVAAATSILFVYVQAIDLGWVLGGDPGVILRRNPDRVRAPDVCFIARNRLPEGRLPTGYLEIVPDFIIEIVSPSDRAVDVQAKIEEWLRAGARLVWAVYPSTRSVVAYRSQTEIRIYSEGDILDGEPVLPGFTCPVARLFV